MTTNQPAWWPDETKQVGTDYNEVAEVAAYDARHSQFRDIEQENQGILEALHLQRDQVLVDLGAGTGVFAVQAAQHCQRVYAVDVSEPMLDFARRRALAAGVDNIEFCRGVSLVMRRPRLDFHWMSGSLVLSVIASTLISSMNQSSHML